MKLFQYYDAANQIRVGALHRDTCFALPGEVTMMQLLGKSSGELEALLPGCTPLCPSGLPFAPVVTASEKILCIGLN